MITLDLIAPTGDDNLLTRHTFALKYLPILLRRRPADGPRLAPVLARELFRLHDQFNMKVCSTIITSLIMIRILMR